MSAINWHAVKWSLSVTTLTVLMAAAMDAQEHIAPGTKVFLQSMHGFEADLTVALIGSNVPVVIVKDRKAAALEVSGRHSQRRGTAFGPDVVEEATLTITNTETGVVIDAYTVTAETTEKLARACAKRLQEKMALPAMAPARKQQPPEGSATVTRASRIFVQGDFNHVTDFIETLRSELNTLGFPVQVVQRGEEYDYNVIFVQADTNASAVVLDRGGALVASVLDSGFRAKGVTEGAAKKLAKRMTTIKR